MTGYIDYANHSAVRSLPLSDRLTSALSFLPELGVQMQVFSGGQPAEGDNRVGSTRHDHGHAADVVFYKDGRMLDWNNPNDIPIFQEIVRRGRSAGLTGFGAGDGYMRPGSMHLGFGAEAVWGADGKGANAPEWLRAAYNGATQGVSQPDTYQPQNTLARGQDFNPDAQQNALARPRLQLRTNQLDPRAFMTATAPRNRLAIT